MVYVVCQTSNCQQTYPLSYFGAVKEDTTNAECPKCGGVLIDEKGHANFSNNATVITVVTPEELEAQRQRNLKEKREELARVQQEIDVLEADEL